MIELPFSVLLVTDRTIHGWGDTLLDRAERALSRLGAGRGAILLRDKETLPEERTAMGHRIRALCHRHQSLFFLSDRVDLALICGADGVQLPEGGSSVKDARSIAPGLRIGRSVHNELGLRQAEEAGADFAMLAPVLEVPGKLPLGWQEFRRLSLFVKIPVVALGGLDGSDLDTGRRFGAAAVACRGRWPV